jgi:hypothetical protein
VPDVSTGVEWLCTAWPNGCDVPRTRTVGRDPECMEINRALVAGSGSYRDIARQYAHTKDALYRHRAEHIHVQLANAANGRARAARPAQGARRPALVGGTRAPRRGAGTRGAVLARARYPDAHIRVVRRVPAKRRGSGDLAGAGDEPRGAQA